MKSTNPAGPTSSPEALTRQLLELSGEAETAAGAHEVLIDVAGRPVLMRFAGSAMREQLLPALAHLESRDGAREPELTVRVWDSDSTSTPAPVPLWGLDDFRERGVIRGFFGDGFYTVFEWGPKTLNVVDTGAGTAFHWIRDAGTLSLPERGAPLRTLFNLWLSGGGTQLVHGAAVGRPDGCVLLIGPSGAGKSSTALSCLDSDLMHLGEDYVLVTSGDPPVVSSIYNTGKLTMAAIERLPGVGEIVAARPGPDDPDPDAKALIDLNSAAGEKLLRRAPLRAIAVPRISEGRETTASPCSAGSALAAVGPSTMLQLPGNGPSSFRWLADLVSSVPCYRLDLGSDPALIPPVAESLLETS